MWISLLNILTMVYNMPASPKCIHNDTIDKPKYSAVKMYKSVF